MKKRIICSILTLCLLILPGCKQVGENEKLFCSGFERLQKQTAVYVRNEQYFGNDLADIKRLTVRTEWRSGEDFYWEGDDGDRYLSYGGNCWTIEPRQHTQWEQRNYIDSFSTWWNNYEPERFLTGEVTFQREGEYIVLEQKKDLGSNNCILSRQISTNTFYMDKDGEIVRITCMTVTYNGTKVDPEKISSVSKMEYYITSVDANEAEAKIRAQYETVME